MNNQNPFDYVTPQMLYQMNNNNQASNFNRSYMPNNPVIERPDFKNHHNMMHNNVGDSILSEHITEYTIHINSVDRDPSVYNNQFKFSVQFGDTTQSYPNITRRFKNIKYIKLENVILPVSSTITTALLDPSGIYVTGDASNVFSNASSNIITNQKYLLLKIKELGNDRVLSTGNIVKSDTIKLYYDVQLNTWDNSWTTNQNSFVYPNANLYTVKKLSFELYDSYGNQILMAGVLPFGSIGATPTTNLTHPLNNYSQMEITLIFGVVENGMNTDPNFES